MRVLITRPAEDAAPLAEAVRARGHEPVIAPLSRIRFEVAEPPPEPPAATIFTSRNAVRALHGAEWASALRALPAYCVGAATAEAARQAGFLHVIAGGGTGTQLGAYIAHVHAPADGPLLYLTGDHLAFDMQDALGPRGFTVWRRIVYRSELVEALSPETVSGIQAGQIEAVMLMSPRAAAHLARLAEEAGITEAAARLDYLCLSGQIADALAPLSASRIRIAHTPSQDALLDLLRPINPA